MTRVPRALGALLMAALLAACAAGTASPSGAAPASQPPAVTQPPAGLPSATGPCGDLILATTTSTQDSGLLDVLVPAFEQQTGCTVKPVAVGSGQALRMGEEGNADVLLVHSPAAEEELVAAGIGIDRKLVMHNSFLILGPREDPAGIRGAVTAREAFARIAAASSPFVSRGDDSGTHAKELGIWKALDTTPDPAWYVESGQGMAATLRIASEKAGYVLTDNATWLAIRDQVDLEALVDSDPALLNPYHVILVNPAKWPGVNADGSRAFAGFLLSDRGQALIGSLGAGKYGEPLFVPDAGKTEGDLGLP